MLCEYGCGKEAKFKMKNGKLCCENFYTKCSKNREKNTNNKGKKSKYKGKTYDEIYGKEKSKILKEIRKVKATGVKFTDERKRKIGKSNKGKILGLVRSQEFKENKRKRLLDGFALYMCNCRNQNRLKNKEKEC